MLNLEILKSPSGVPLYVRTLSDSVQQCQLAASVMTQFTVPANARIAVFGFASGVDYWVGTANFTGIPNSSTPETNPGNPELNPSPIDVAGVSTLFIISPSNAVISISFYS